MPMIRLVLNGLKLPRANEVTRWNRWQQRRESKRVRAMAEASALMQGLGDAVPLDRASVTITVRGPYRGDHDGRWVKDALDAIVARPLRVPVGPERVKLIEANGLPMRRWGLIVDDRPGVIGTPKVVLEHAVDYCVEIVVDTVDAAG